MPAPLDPVIEKLIPLLPLRDSASMTPKSVRDSLRALSDARAAVPPPPVETVRDVITRLGDSGIAVEAMCFTDFPTETAPEALATLRFLDELRDDVALFIVGQFGLTHGALVAQAPQDFGLKDTWQLEGDELGTGLFFAERVPAKSDADRARVERALDRLAGGWQLRHYPWAGALSTAHTVYYYDRMGREVFRKLAAQKGEATIFGRRVEVATARFCLEDLEGAALVATVEAPDPVHAVDAGRFATRPDGVSERRRYWHCSLHCATARSIQARMQFASINLRTGRDFW